MIRAGFVKRRSFIHKDDASMNNEMALRNTDTNDSSMIQETSLAYQVFAVKKSLLL
jgi:hypothetical protein